MAAPSKAWVVVADTQVDADSPLDTTLVTALRDDTVHLEEWLGKDYTAAQNHDHDGTNSAKVNMANVSKTGAVEVFDDFPNGVVSGGILYSSIPWTINSGGVSVAAGANGLVTLTGDGTTARYGIQTLTTKPFKLSGGNTLTFEAKVILSGTVSNYYYFGLMDTDDLTGNGIIFSTDATAAIKAKCMAAAALTWVTTARNWIANTTYKFKIVATASQVLFYIDDVLEATITTNIPTAAMGLCLFIRGSVATCTVDYVQCTSSARV